MEKLKLNITMLILGSFLVCMMLPGANAHNGECAGKERVTKIRFFNQDVLAGDNQTVWKVAQSNLTDVLPSQFGLVYMLDNLMTSGPEMDSGEVGRLQGIVGLSDLREVALVMLLDAVFTKGEYQGSTLTISGRNPLGARTREVPIVGGTGAFRMARGYATVRTYYSRNPNIYGVYQYDLVVCQYE